MEYRNSGAATHLSKGLVTNVEGLTGIDIDGSTITSASDSAASGLTIAAKGTGPLTLGNSSNVVTLAGSTTPFKIVSGESTMTAPAMAANSQAESTFTATGISTADLIICVDFRNTLSTSYLPGMPYVGAADKIHVPIGNCHGSTISASTGVVVRWSYIDRT